MPCDSGESGYERDVRHHDEVTALKKRIRELTALLCAACTGWEAARKPPSVEAWWRQHRAKDKQRLADQQRKAAKSRQARQVTITRLERQRSQIDAELRTLKQEIP